MKDAIQNDYSKSEILLAKFAKALGHPARIAIINLLIKKKSCICGSIVDELPIAQSTVSQHLKELKSAGLIKGNTSGVSVCYCIDEKNWALAQQLFSKQFEKNKHIINQCC